MNPRSGRRVSLRVGIVVALVNGFFVVTGGPALAEDPVQVWASCAEDSRQSSCRVGARNEGHDQARRSVGGGTGAARQSGVGEARQCRSPLGDVIPCHHPDFGDLGSDGCYYKPVSVAPSDEAVFGGRGQEPGGWFDYTCIGVPGTGGGRRWVVGAAPAAAAPPSPDVLARQALSQLKLPRPSIGMNPAGPQLVGVPTWLWLDQPTWRTRSATATVPGVSVTVTARPVRVVWSTGDGGRVTCTGPGTPWRPGTDPAVASPTCGHTYTLASRPQPDGAFEVSASVSWSVTWSGAGQTGDLSSLTTSATTAVQVREVHAVVLSG